MSPASRSGTAGRPSCCAPPRAGPGPHEVDGVQVEDTNLSHQVPLSGIKGNPAHLEILQEWLEKYRPDELFDESGRLVEELRALAPEGDKRMSATPFANGGRLLKELPIKDLQTYALDVRRGVTTHESTRPMGELMRDVYAADVTEDGGGHVPAVLSGRDGEQPAPGRVRDHRPLSSRRRCDRRTRRSPPTAGSWRCSPSTSAPVGSRGTS